MRPFGFLLRAVDAPGGVSGGRALARLATTLVVAVALFSAGFLAIMRWEGQEHSILAAVYWTVVTMSTLGYGDIVFASDPGRIYSVVVLAAGAVLILVILPFTFIQWVYLPWRDAARQAQTPRSLPPDLGDHLLLTGDGEVEEVLIRRAHAVGMPYAILVQGIDRAIALRERGHDVMVGSLDDPATYRSAGAERAALIFSARSDHANSNVAFTVREFTDQPLLVVTANDEDSVDVLELAGADHVLQLGELLGQALARRILSPRHGCQVIGTFEHVEIAEMIASGTAFDGRQLSDIDLRDPHDLYVVGAWHRGRFVTADADVLLGRGSILVLAGDGEAMERYAASLNGHRATGAAPVADAGGPETSDATVTAGPAPKVESVLVIGGGRVGRSVARAVQQAGMRCRIVERDESRLRDEFDYVRGDAADRQVLAQAGIDDASAVVVTTHDDDANVFLTLYARKLRDDVLVLGRVAHEQNLSTMYRAGADFVLSYASTGAAAVWNHLHSESTLLLTDGLVAFRAHVPPKLAGRRLGDVDVASVTGCTVVAVLTGDGSATQPDPTQRLPPNARLVLIGPEDGQRRFVSGFGARAGIRRRGRRLTTVKASDAATAPDHARQGPDRSGG